jgi:mono/diheme cytochrome c family protein
MHHSRIHHRQFWPLAAAGALCAAAAGCQQKMADQPSYKPLVESTFFEDGKSARDLPAGTVARGHLRVNNALYTGRTTDLADIDEQAEAVAEKSGGHSEKTPGGFDENAAFVTDFPIPVTESVIEHGRNRYMIYCVVCHDALGTGRGKIVERGYTAPPSYHIDRLRNGAVGRLFAVVSDGYGSMPSYGSQIPAEDRWAIIAYVRALQLSQHFPAEKLTDEMREQLRKAPEVPTASEVLGPKEQVH